MFLFSSFNMIGKGFKHKCKLPEGKIYYLDFYERCVRPVEKINKNNYESSDLCNSKKRKQIYKGMG